MSKRHIADIMRESDVWMIGPVIFEGSEEENMAKLKASETGCACMDGVREHAEGMPVQLVPTLDTSGARWAIKAFNEAGHNHTLVDVLDLVDWLAKNRPDLLGRHANE